jgi:hypothetical protein
MIAQEEPPLPQVEYFTVETTVLDDGTEIGRIAINGPPTPPPGVERPVVELSELSSQAGLVVLSEVPTYDWSYGCSATSAAMIAAYYDRTLYPDIYTGPTNGGVMPMDNSTWGHTTWPRCDEPGTMSVGECPLSATHNGIDGRSTRGHVDDYWTGYDCLGPDPYVTNGWVEHTLGDCTGDYMNTSKWFSAHSYNKDGETYFYYYNSGAPMPTSDMVALGPPYSHDGTLGFELFYESRGYTVATAYNQLIRGEGSNPGLGFTYDQYKAEIDAGRPVIIHVRGHTMVGVGYDDTSSDLMYIHDTWDYDTHTMTWGASYSDMSHYMVSIVQLESPSTPAPTVTSITPPSGLNTGPVHITNLAGSNFQSGATVKLTKSGQSDINAANVNVVSASKITCDLDLTGAATGLWNVTITNPDLQSDTLPNGFTVTAPGGEDHFVYLPMVSKRYPPVPDTPVLHVINNPDGDGNYSVNWSSAYLANTYTLQEDNNAAFSSPSTAYSGSWTSTSIAGNGPGTYYYRVRANNSWGHSGWSNIRQVTVLSPPGRPTLNPISNSDGDGNYTVSWNTVAQAQTYVLQEDDNASFSSPSTRYTGSGTSWHASGKAPGTYHYRVKASNSMGDSGWSNVRQVTVSPPMAEVHVKNDTGGELCYKVDDTGIGKKCFSSGRHFYGTFPSGTYTWHASARCGSASGTKYYGPGVLTHRFWCD